MTKLAKVVDIRDDAASDEQQDALDPVQVPPNALDSEGVILSALLTGDEAALRLVMDAGLKYDHFYASANARVFEGVVGCFAKHSTVDVRLVAGWMRDAGTLHRVGGAVYLAQLVDCTPAAANLMLHVGEVVEKAKQRRLIAAMQSVAVKMRHGELSHDGARTELRAHFESERKKS